MEKILSIKEKIFEVENDGYKQNYDGYEILTNKQTIKIGINSGQCCCEDYGCSVTNEEGHIITEDNISDFIGSDLIKLNVVDNALKNTEIETLEYLDEGGAMFINVETTNGLLQFVAYNAHNGYYGHDAVLISKRLNKEVCL